MTTRVAPRGAGELAASAARKARRMLNSAKTESGGPADIPDIAEAQARARSRAAALQAALRRRAEVVS